MAQEEKNNWAPPIPKAILDQEAAADAIIKDEAEPGDTIIHNPDLEREEKTDILPEPAAKPKEEAPEKDWETKYRVLQGKYDSEVRALQQGNRDLTTKVEALTETIANLNNLLIQMRSEKPASEKEVVPGEDGDLTEESFEGYGPEMSKFYRRFTALETENATLKEKLRKVDRMEQVITRTEEQAKVDEAEAWVNRLTHLLGFSWHEVNDAPEFETWLKADDNLLLEQAQTCSNARKAEKLIKIVQQFQRETGWKPSEPREGIEGQVVPDSVGPGTPRQPKSQKRVTEAQYKRAIEDRCAIPPRITEGEFDRIIMAYQRTIQEDRVGRTR